METAEDGPGSRKGVLLSGAGLNWAVLLLLVVIWGSTFAGISIGVETIDPAWLVAGRLLGAASFLAVWLVATRAFGRKARADALAPVSAEMSAPVTMKAIVWFSFIGVAATATPFVLFAISAQSIGSAVMAICNGATPFATALLAHAFVGDRLTARRVAGVLLGFLGLVVLVLPELGKEGAGNLFGISIAVFGACLYSIGNVGTRMAPRVGPAASSFIIVLSAGLATLVLALVTAPFPEGMSARSLTAMVMLALFPTAFAMFLYVWLIQRTGAVFVSFVTYMAPLWATGLGVTLMGEKLQWSMMGALALILVGVAVANWRPRAPVRVSP